jgi:hypothetical protein
VPSPEQAVSASRPRIDNNRYGDRYPFAMRGHCC